ncbi:MAG: hypothetical protein FWC34_02015 [Bacteroidetes bacterium]|nr:hypothetical protein [Bacteroidota bacterium]MCL2302002.1 hypothetical protein [Lentimicrobiaceae bacterium]
MKKRVPFYMKVAVLIALFATSLFFIFNKRSDNQILAAPVHQILTEAIKEIQKSKSMRIDMKIRTLEGDNFELIGTEYDFVKHLIKVEFSSPKKWRIEKPGRTVLCDGKNQYLNIEIMDYIIKGSVNAGFVEWLHIFLTPDKILEIEKERAKKEQSEYNLKETENQLILTVFQKAQGNFTNDYLKNSSVIESDNKRVFYFDKTTHQLLAFELYIVENGNEILVMKTTEIKYNETFDPKDFSVKIFGNKKIKDIEELELKADKSLKDKTPEEIAFYFFDACAQNDWEKVEKVYSSHSFLIKKIYGGLEIIEIGTAFQSGKYPGYFVPYTVKLKSGEVKKFNLAVRNDNSQKMWEIDGGI